MDEIQTHITRRGRRNPIFRRCRAKADRKAISTWKLDLDGILGVFNVCSVTPARRLLER